MSERLRLGTVAAAAAVCILGVGSWILWRTRHQPHALATGVDAVEPRKATAGVLTLRVDSWSRVDIVPGTPIIFDVSLSAPKGAPRVEIGRPGRSWHSLVRLVDAGTGDPVPWPIVRLGSPQSATYSDSDGGGRTAFEARDAAVVDHDHVHHLVLATSPETMGGVAPGTYAVRAALEGDSRLESDPVTIVVRGPGESPDRDRLERERVARSAEFYLEANRFEDARRLSEELTTREPKNTGAWMLLGDSLDGLGKPQEALAAYRHALAVAPRTYEEPTLLYERMGAMWRKLAQ